MKYYLIAGEASGDLHSANLMRAIKARDEAAEFRVWGGDRMEEAGGILVEHYKNLAFMGFTEVVSNLGTILRKLRKCKDDLRAYRPDALILVDYPGFNLRIAKFAHQEGIRTFYYISPQVWAWKRSRVHQIRRHIERMFVILPFEKSFYERYGVDVEFVGHPLIDAIEAYKNDRLSLDSLRKGWELPEKPIVLLLPGSRKQEVQRMLPVMLDVTEHFPDHQFVIGAAPSLTDDFYRALTGDTAIPVIRNRNYTLMEHATAALVTSGTATLETALFQTPLVVCYSGGATSFWIAKKLVNVDFISLVNLIMEKEVVTELIQNELTAPNLLKELRSILPGGEKRESILTDLETLRQELGGPGASRKTAEGILQRLRQ